MAWFNKKIDTAKANTPEEVRLLNKGTTWIKNAEGNRNDIETTWEDEYKMYVGKQWDTTIAPRTSKAKKYRPNSQDNFIFPSLYNMHSVITATDPESIIESPDESNQQMVEAAEKLTDIIADERYKNRFSKLWKRLVLEGLKHGPFIHAVLWDGDWIGGSGPDQWIGEIKHVVVDKKDFLPDPAITNLEDRLQECGYIIRRMRKKIDYIKDRWPDKGIYVQEDSDSADNNSEGPDPQQATVYEVWHKGKPEYVSSQWKEEFSKKAQEMEDGEFPYKVKDYQDKASGTLKGVHVAYMTKDIVLDYIPYVYDDGMYPFAYAVLYEDEENPFGLGEIRNVMMPQIAHNKADEIELEAMAKEGLGGAYYNKGTLTSKQKTDIEENSGKGGAWLEVNDITGFKERTGPKVPATIDNYKEHKQRMIERITQDTPIQQGLAPSGGVTAYSALKELGDRSDTKNKGKLDILKDLLIDITQLELNRIAQFYSVERSYTVRTEKAPKKMQDAMGNPILKAPVQNGTFSNKDMYFTWQRTDGQDFYVPSWNVKVKVMDEKPTDRNYYINTATTLTQAGLMDVESLWYTIEEGKFPPRDEILARLQAQAAQTVPVPGQESIPGAGGQGGTPTQETNEQPTSPDEQQLTQILANTDMNQNELKTFLTVFQQMPQADQQAFLNMSPEEQKQALNQILGGK